MKDFDKIESQNDSGVTSETSSGDTASDSGDSESQLRSVFILMTMMSSVLDHPD